MGRNKKAVVDYFPHFVNHGKTMFTLENKYGNDGYAFWFKLLELLGSAEQHFIDCNNVEMWEYMLAKTRLSDEKVTEMLFLLAKIGAIDKDLWDKKIIRSDNFIENLAVVYKRREIDVYTNEEIEDLCLHKLDLNDISVDKKQQSKVKESKEKEIDKEKVFECEFFSVSKTLHDSFLKSYPINLMQEYQKMYSWLLANPTRQKKDYKRFINNWLSSASQRNPPSSVPPPLTNEEFFKLRNVVNPRNPNEMILDTGKIIPKVQSVLINGVYKDKYALTMDEIKQLEEKSEN